MDRFPGEVDRVSVSGDGGEAGGDPGGEGVAEEQGYGRGFGAAQLEGVAVEFDGADALGGVGVGFALLGGGVEGAAGVVCSLQMDLGRFGCGELEGLGGGGFRWGLLGVRAGECAVKPDLGGDWGGAGLAQPFDHGAVAGCGCPELQDGWRSCAGGGEGLVRGAGGASGGVEDCDAIGEQSWGIGGQGRGQGIDGVGGAGLYGEAVDWGAGGGGVGLAAELGGQGALEVATVGGAGGSRPVELDLVADALGGEVGHHFGEVQGGRARIAGTGTADCDGNQQRHGACGEASGRVPVTWISPKIHWLSA